MHVAHLQLLSMALAIAAAAAAEGPCDILATAGNPCVAAHSTTRALYAHYDGALYNVSRPDGTTRSVGVLSAGGFADISVHEEFCAKLDCVISHVIDQSPQGNHLGQRHRLVNASQHKIKVGPAHTPVYGMWFDPGFGYHVDNTTGIATGNEPESIFAVMSGTHYNGGWCATRVTCPVLTTAVHPIARNGCLSAKGSAQCAAAVCRRVIILRVWHAPHTIQSCSSITLAVWLYYEAVTTYKGL